MKFSLKLAQHTSSAYGTSKDPFEYGVDEIVQKIGLQLGAVEDVVRTGDKYDGVVTAKVVSCEKHPNADKLSLCMIDDGGVVQNMDRDESGYIQVVCGASNVAAGQTIAWIPPGVTVPSTAHKEPFVLEARELRGKVSNGMIASMKELAIGDEHDGILEITADDVGEELLKPGTEFKKLYGLDDVIIDCENKMFTHRPDCFGNLGIAREVAGIFGDKFTSPEWYTDAITNEKTADLPLDVKNDITSKVPRFTVQAMSDVEVSKSPMWLQAYLNNIGIKSINNIVDYTNFFSMNTGQPLHAFDYDKVKKLSENGVVLQPRMAKKDEEITLLGGKTVKLSEDDIVIATDKTAIAIGGVMGGADTEVDDNTKNIIIECANFDMYAIRRTSMRHGLFTDAVTRFNKGQSPLQNDKVLAKMVEEVVKYAGGKVASEVFDIAGFDLSASNLNTVTTTANFINSRLGTALSEEEIKKLLENTEFTVALQSSATNPQSAAEIHITAPFWRMDIGIPEDIVEEVGRLHGYQNIPIELPARTSKPSPKNQVREFKQLIRSKLVPTGANEVLTYSFVHGDLMKKTGSDPEKWAIHLRNALSPELQYYRTSLLPSLLAKVHGNIKAGAGSDSNEFALFEIGKVHVKGHNEEAKGEEGLPKQMNRIALVVAADMKTTGDQDSSAYFQAKKYVDLVTNGQAKYQSLDTNEYPLTSPYQKERSAVVTLGEDGQFIGVVGELRTSVRKALKLPNFCAGVELDLDLLRENYQEVSYKQMSNYPSTAQDVTYEVAADTLWETVHEFIRAELSVARAESGYNFTVVPQDIFQKEDSDKKRFSFRMEFNHDDKTLKTEEVNKLLENVSKAINEKLGATRI